MTDGDFPSIYEAANKASGETQRSFSFLLKSYLICLIISTVFSSISGAGVWIAFLQVVSLLVGLALSIYLWATKPQQAWYGARALAESVKTVTWRYMMRAEPFDRTDEVDSRALVKILKEIFKSNQKIAEHAVEEEEGISITPKMTEIRSLNLGERKSFYRNNRVADQLRWYRSKSKYNKKTSKIWFCILIGLNFLAILSAMLKIVIETAEFWPTEIFVSAAASSVAWMQMKKFQELSTSYSLTAIEIGILSSEIDHIRSENDFSKFVGDAESAFSREHTQWQARRDVE